jgi:hypothetical protein
LGDATGRIDPLKLLEDSNYITEGGEEPPSTAKNIYIKINTLPSTIRPPWIGVLGLSDHTQYRVRGLPIQYCQSEYLTFPASFMWGTQLFVFHDPTPAIGPKGRMLK